MKILAMTAVTTICAVMLAGDRRRELEPGPRDIHIDAVAAQRGVDRFGLNLGSWTSWGAEQLMSNVLKNPGFEGMIDRQLVKVALAGGSRFVGGEAWHSRPDGFWIGAAFEVRTGRNAGRKGLVRRSRQSGAAGLPEFEAAEGSPAVEVGEVVALTRTDDLSLPANWWIPDSTGSAAAVVVGDVRPGSPGRRSLTLAARAGRVSEVASYLDAIGVRAGKMLPVNGRWSLSFWCRRTTPSTRLQVRFGREGQKPFLEAFIPTSTDWQHHRLDFDAADDGSPAALGLHFEVTGESGAVLLDDAALGPADPPSPFRDEVVKALERLKPAYLRDWQGQLGDTIENRFASAFARRTSRMRPGGSDASEFFYSLPDFLDLCRTVGATPWIVAPTTLDDSEWLTLGRRLRELRGAGVFDEILIEFGNENWNAIFSPAGLMDPVNHGHVAGRAFDVLRQAAGVAPWMHFVVNGPFADPQRVLEFAARTRGAEILAVAPYTFYSLDAAQSGIRTAPELFPRDANAFASLLREHGIEGAAAELNLHTTGGLAVPSERNRWTSGAISGAALASRLLRFQAAGIRRQCVYVLAGFDTLLANGTFTHLWGIVRDLGSTERLRPTGLALELLNQAAGGDLHLAPRVPDGLDIAAFHTDRGWTLAAVSSRPDEQQITVHLPESEETRLPDRVRILSAASWDATNEDEETVRIVEEPIRPNGGTLRFQLPAWGVAVLLRERTTQ